MLRPSDAAAHAAGRRFPHPIYKGYPLDWCKTFAEDCGQPAADYFCDAKGFGRAVSFEGPEAMPQADGIATVLPAQGSACSTELHACDTFASITCG